MPEVFSHYYELFDLDAREQLQLKRFTPGYKVFFENQPALSVAADVEKDAALFEEIEPGAGANLRDYVKDSSLVYTLALQHFLYTSFSSWPRSMKAFLNPAVLRYGFKMLRLAFRTLDAHVSARFSDERLKQLLEYHAVFLGASPFQAPAIYSLMTHLDFASGVYYPQRGMLQLPEDLYNIGKNLGVTYHFNSDIRKIRVQSGRATAIETEVGEVIEADIVVSNADLHFSETSLLEKQWQTYPDAYWAKREPGPSALLVSLGIRGSLPNIEHHNLYLVDEWRENFDAIYTTKTLPKNASLYICNPSKTDPTLAPQGHENVFILVPIAAGMDVDEQIADRLTHAAIEVLQKITGRSGLKDAIVAQKIFGPKDFKKIFNAWEGNAFGGESHILRQSALFRTRNRSRKVRNLFYVGAGTQPGIGLPMCLIGAQVTYREIIGSKRSGPLKKEEL